MKPQIDILDIARVKPSARTRFVNGGWAYDRYKELETLDAGRTITVADLPGPGIIRQLAISTRSTTGTKPNLAAIDTSRCCHWINA